MRHLEGWEERAGQSCQFLHAIALLWGLTFGPQNRYTTLVWRFLPVAVEIDVRPEIPGLERTRTTDQKFSARAIFWEA